MAEKRRKTGKERAGRRLPSGAALPAQVGSDVSASASGKGVAKSVSQRDGTSPEGDVSGQSVSPRPSTSSKSRIVPVRFSPADFERIEQVAAANDVSVSEFVRQSVLHGGGRVEVAEDIGRGLLSAEERLLFSALLEEVRRVGVNVNQIALRLNVGRSMEAGQLGDALSYMREVLGGLAFELRQLSLDPVRSAKAALDA